MEVNLTSKHNLPIQGQYKEVHYDWVLPKKPVVGQLSSKMEFHRRWIDGIYSVDIKPMIDCTAQVK